MFLVTRGSCEILKTTKSLLFLVVLLVLRICLFYRVLIWSSSTGRTAVWLYINLKLRIILHAEFFFPASTFAFQSDLNQREAESNQGIQVQI